MSTAIAPNRADLPPPSCTPDTPTHLLQDNARAVGWTRAHHIGFLGFADEIEASGAAWVAHRAIVNRLARDRFERPVPVDIEPLSLAKRGDIELILASGFPIAHLFRPQRLPWSPEPGFGFEIELAHDTTEVRLNALAYLAYRTLRRTGCRWAMWRKP